jgi:acyl carrier protein
MTREEIREAVLKILGGLAPEVDLAAIRTGADLREELDIDSMDFLNFIIRVHERLGVNIPENHYPRVRSLDGCVEYLASRLGAAAPGEARGGG